MATIIGMVLLVLAGISFPSQVEGVDGLNQKIVLIGWHVGMVGVEALVALSLVGLPHEGAGLALSLGVKLDFLDISWAVSQFFNDLLDH